MTPMHDKHFPDSDEAGESRTQRAIDALNYEESAGIGFRRRSIGEQSGDPYGKPEAYIVGDDSVSGGQVLAGYLAAVAVVLGAGALVYKPLLLGTIAAIAGVSGAIAGGPAGRTAKTGLIIASFGFFFGMLFSILLERPVF
jgi:hypothetical protein